jgi:nucleoside permease NupC
MSLLSLIYLFIVFFTLNNKEFRVISSNFRDQMNLSRDDLRKIFSKIVKYHTPFFSLNVLCTLILL